MKRYLITTFLLAFIGGVLLIRGASAQEQRQVTPPPTQLDIAIVLDNSGSMKKNDPGFLTKQVVSNFLSGLTPEARISLVIFSGKAEIALPLTAIGSQEAKQKALAGLNRVDYSGNYTNSPAAIERALYELKEHGRKEAQKAIIFMTDGIIATGDKQKDREGEQALRGELAEQSKASGVRIFGIAFTEEADYLLIQALSQKTGGDYYRALKAEDIQAVFTSIREAISKPPVVERPVATKVVEPQPKGGSTGLLIVAVVGLIALAIVVVFLRGRGKTVVATAPMGTTQEEDVAVPPAMLLDEGSVTDRVSHEIKKRVTRIGRAEEESPVGQPDMDIAIPKGTVSSLHATIEYRDLGFYLVDQRSLNGTYLNGKKVTGETRLKSGDEIAFDRYKFKFLLPGQGEQGGTVLNPSPGSGRTLLSVAEAPEPASLQPEQPGPAVSPLPISRPDAVGEEDEEIGTKLKPGMCPDHPSFRATELCPVCKIAYGKECMVEKDGKQICKKCATAASRQHEFRPFFQGRQSTAREVVTSRSDD